VFYQSDLVLEITSQAQTDSQPFSKFIVFHGNQKIENKENKKRLKKYVTRARWIY
jgi:hypothetical protein